MKIKPLGFYVLVEVDEVESVSAGGIFLGDVKREQEGCEFGIVRGVGPVAYAGLPGCERDHAKYALERPQFQAEDFGYLAWGFDIGDKVEYRRYEGKLSNHPDMKNFRYIPDSHIIGLVVEE